MASSKVLENLNIRKFRTYEDYKAATIGEDDLCVVTGDGIPVLETATLPTPSADLEGIVYLYTGSGTSRQNGVLYVCESDGQDPASYFWKPVTVPASSGTATSNVGIATASGNNALAVGRAARAEGDDNLSVGQGSSANYPGSTSVGTFAWTSNRGVAVGKSATADDYGVAVGTGVKAGVGGVILGNSTFDNDASLQGVDGCFEIILVDPTTYTATKYGVLNTSGGLQADRLASTTGLADGNYRLRLVMASGVPTLEWVAE